MFKTALMKELRQAGLGDIELVSELEPTYPNPVLVVEPGAPELFWTPFYATSRLSIQAGYASAGDTSFMGDRPATIDNRNGPALSMHGDYKVTDSSWGLISRPGYHQILADYMAREIIAALKDVYQVS